MSRGHIYSYILDGNFRTNFPTSQTCDLLSRYSVTTGASDATGPVPREFGWSASNPLLPVVIDGPQTGRLAQEASFCRVDRPNVLVTALKRAEDGSGFILRLIETAGEACDTTVSLPFLPVTDAFRTDLAENGRERLRIGPDGLTAPIKAFGITTVRVLASPAAVSPVG